MTETTGLPQRTGVAHHGFMLFITNKAGDLDNRLKVLFDALRIPRGRVAIFPGGDSPKTTEMPLCCLLENDLITAIRKELKQKASFAPSEKHQRPSGLVQQKRPGINGRI